MVRISGYKYVNGFKVRGGMCTFQRNFSHCRDEIITPMGQGCCAWPFPQSSKIALLTGWREFSIIGRANFISVYDNPAQRNQEVSTIKSTFISACDSVGLFAS